MSMLGHEIMDPNSDFAFMPRDTNWSEEITDRGVANREFRRSEK